MQAASGGPSALQQTAPHHALLPFLLLLLLLLLGPALGEVAYVSQVGDGVLLILSTRALGL
jgi:hypothetical protein